MPQATTSDVAAIRMWIAKEPHLPQNFDDLMLRKFLHSCYGSLERTKQCIERFCTTRTLMTELYTSRDIDSKAMKTSLDTSYVTCNEAGDMELLIYHVDDPGLEKFVFMDALKSFAIEADYWIQYMEFYPKGHIIIFDLRNVTLKVIPKVNIMYLRDFILFLLEGFPVRVVDIHIVNCPAYVETLYNIVKPILPNDIREMVKFHKGTEGLDQVVDKKFLPKDYGGEMPNLRQQQLDRLVTIEEKKEMFLDDNLWKADLTKKPKNMNNVSTMNGSFRTLSID